MLVCMHAGMYVCVCVYVQHIWVYEQKCHVPICFYRCARVRVAVYANRLSLRTSVQMQQERYTFVAWAYNAHTLETWLKYMKINGLVLSAHLERQRACSFEHFFIGTGHLEHVHYHHTCSKCATAQLNIRHCPHQSSYQLIVECFAPDCLSFAKPIKRSMNLWLVAGTVP